MPGDPVLIAYGVKQSSKTERNIWRRIGEAFPHEDGAGLTLVLNALPPDGRVILLEPDAADDKRLEREARRFRKPERMIGTGHD
ncbi:MAG: hypothetical protein ABL904_23250 [Hyphomicrobiaceae bacterium]